jgi:serine/threonine protein kinase
VLKEFVLPIGIDSDARRAATEKFLSDAELLRGLKHPCIVELFDCFIEDHRGYLVLERISGESLKDLVARSGALGEAEVVELMKQMIEILGYLHGRTPPVVHRDFTPDNLILRGDGMLKLVDFNVAQQSGSGVTGTMVGKPAYIAPEQVAGEFSPASDIYSLGATLFFPLTASEPEPITSSHPACVVPEVSQDMDGLVSKCTQFQIADRPICARQILAIYDNSIA